jgi:ParB/RepB/Spo0J family partition protein
MTCGKGGPAPAGAEVAADGSEETPANNTHADNARGPTRRIAAIAVGERHRKDLGDIDGLAASIAELGLLQPVVIRPDGALIAGKRRLEAFKLLGRADIPVTVIDIDAVVKGEFAENSIRKDFMSATV